MTSAPNTTRRSLLAGVIATPAAVIANRALGGQDPWAALVARVESVSPGDGAAAVGRARRWGLDPTNLSGVAWPEPFGRRTHLYFRDATDGRRLYIVTAASIGRHEWPGASAPQDA